MVLNKFYNADSQWYWIILALAVLVTGEVTGGILGLIRAKNVVYRVFNCLLKKIGAT